MAIQDPVALGTIDDVAATTHVFTIPAGGVPIGALMVVRALMTAGVGSAGFDSIADSRSNTYALDIKAGDVTSTEWVVIATSVLATALVSGDTVTITLSTSGTCGAAYAYFTAGNGWRATQLDKTASNTNASAGTWTSTATATTAQAEELLLGVCSGNPSTSSSTPTGGFTGEQNLSLAQAARRLVTEYKIVAATGAYAATGSWAPNASAVAAIATYKSAPPPTTEANLYLYHGEP